MINSTNHKATPPSQVHIFSTSTSKIPKILAYILSLMCGTKLHAYIQQNVRKK